MLGPTCLLFSLTKAYAPCMPLRAQTSGGTLAEHWAAARITKAMTIVAERDSPHRQLCRKVEASDGQARRRRVGSSDILDQNTVPTFKGLIDELHGFWETIAD